MSTLYVVERFYEGRYRWSIDSKTADEWRPVLNLRSRTDKAKAEADLKSYKEKHGKKQYWEHGEPGFRVVQYRRVEKADKKKTKKKAPTRR